MPSGNLDDPSGRSPVEQQNYGDAAPLTGITLDGLDQTIDVTVQVQPFESR